MRADTTTCAPAVAPTEPAGLRAYVSSLLDHGRTDFALVRCSVFDFREISGSLGHTASTALLDAIGGRLAARLLPTERWAVHPSGDFLLLLSGADPDRLRDRVDDMVRAGSGWTPHVYGQLTAGMAPPAGYGAADDLFAHAELALAEATRQGPGTVTVCAADLVAGAHARVALDTDLRRAVEAGRLTVHYQPVVALDSGAIVGYEALARWPDNTRGWVRPDEFIPAAERTGLISEIGMMVVRKALADRQRYGTHDGAWMSVNVSPIQLDDPSFARMLLAILADAGVDGSALRVEVTESALLGSARARAQLVELRRRGVRVLVDDFGTGFSSLASLRRLPIDGIKISRELLHDEQPGLPDPTVVRAVRLLAAGAGVTDVIAEGVENALEVKTLAALGMPYAQGFHLGRPAPASRAMRWLGTAAQN